MFSPLLLAASIAATADLPAPQTVTYREVDGRALAATIHRPVESAEAPAAMLLFHGGGWRFGNHGWMTPTAEMLAANGAVGITVEYRLAHDGLTPGDAAKDTCAALRWARDNAAELGVDAERIGLYGVSAGGHLAALAGTSGCADTAPPDLLVLYSPAIRTSRDGWFKKLMGTEDVLAFSPLENVRTWTPPSLVVSGEADTLTPHRWAANYCDLLEGLGTECEMVAYAGKGHLLTRNLEQQERDFDVAPEDIDRARAEILDFLGRHDFLD